jgi:uncharacterized protein (DUF2147 family)
MRISTIFMSALTGAGLLAGGPAWAAADPRGVWLDDKGQGAVEITDCGARLCGHVVWARDEADSKEGCGKQIIGDVAPQGGGLWDNGWIYDPDTRKKYDVELKALDDNRLRVKGYAGVKFFSRSMIWTRAPADLKKCNAGDSKTADPVRSTNPGATTPTVEANAPPKNETAKSPDVSARREPSPARPPEVKSPEVKSGEAAPPTKTDGPKVATAEDPREPEGRPRGGALHEKLRDLKFGDGYGVTETGNGHCRLRVPYFSMTFDCQKD